MDEWFLIELSVLGSLIERVTIQGRAAAGRFVCERLKSIPDLSKRTLLAFVENTKIEGVDVPSLLMGVYVGGVYVENGFATGGSVRIYTMTSPPRFANG